NNLPSGTGCSVQGPQDIRPKVGYTCYAPVVLKSPSGPRCSDLHQRGDPMLSRLLSRSRARRVRPVGRPTVLTVEVLESRYTPASAVYNAVTASLTVNAAPGEQLTISQNATKPAGNLQVASNVNGIVFNNPAGNTRFVKNLTVKIAAGSGGGTGQVNLSSAAL